MSNLTKLVYGLALVIIFGTSNASIASEFEADILTSPPTWSYGEPIDI